MVYGCLRYQAQLDFLIGFYSARKVERLDLPVLLALRTGIFQLRYLERIPRHAAVNEAVNFVKIRKRFAAGFVNAVLRKVNRDPIPWPNLSTELSCPAWLLESWTHEYGHDRALTIAGQALVEPHSYIRIPPGASAPSELEIQPASNSGCYRVLGGTVAEIRLQDIGSQAIIPMLDLQPEHSLLDLCSAPGNKTLQAVESKPRLAIACDISFRRLSTVPPVCPRVVLDGCHALPFRITFDRILVDAPCSGTGTLARNPEIKYRLAPSDLPRFANRQVQLLKQALQQLSSPGRLLYATCSLQRAENEEVVAAALAAFPARTLVTELHRLPGIDEGDGFYAALIQ